MSHMEVGQRILLQKTFFVHFIKTPTHYYYVAIPGAQVKEFLANAQEGKINLSDHEGVLLCSGEGTPSEDIKKRMKAEYGCNHDVRSLDISNHSPIS